MAGNYQRRATEPETPQEFPTCTFIDIETVRGKRTFSELSPRMQDLYLKRYAHEISEPAKAGLGLEWSAESHYEARAGYSAEFGQIVAVSMGAFHKTREGTKFSIKTIASRHEKELLINVGKSLQKSSRLCAHNGNEFDFPYLMRRYVVNGLHVPSILNIFGRRGAWDYPFDDTMAMWSHAQWKYKVSLDLLAELLGLPSPKSDMDGSMVADIFYGMFDSLKSDELPIDAEEIALNRIGAYCGIDMVTLANVYCTLHEFPLITNDMIIQHGTEKAV